EIAVPARYGNALIERLAQIGADLGATPYGTEALGVLRIEKGHAAGSELNGQTTALMLSLGRMVSEKKDSIGAVMSRREGLAQDKRRLVGFRPVNGSETIVPGSHLFTQGETRNMTTDQGWITSAAYSPHVGSSIALGFLEEGDLRMGEIVVAANPLEGREARVEVVSLHFVDPEGGRLRD
ncbi:glycine cleavage T C-terminal barrel domain-containing protein, partial [Marivivens donghaensis]|uniref:glycine cleavage T C-terminal barrel domain-containing protein n=1 Tax=Marivivens donghaensis TaxID=1699413 RepID=UPI003F69ABBD